MSRLTINKKNVTCFVQFTNVSMYVRGVSEMYQFDTDGYFGDFYTAEQQINLNRNEERVKSTKNEIIIAVNCTSQHATNSPIFTSHEQQYHLQSTVLHDRIYPVLVPKFKFFRIWSHVMKLSSVQ